MSLDMTYADLQKASECHAALREIFIHYPGGWADKDALHSVEKLSWQAMTVVKDAECQEQMGIVEHYAAALYSESEHHKWGMGSLSGADFLRLQILRALVAFHGRLLAIEAARRNDDVTPTYPRPLESPERDTKRSG